MVQKFSHQEIYNHAYLITTNSCIYLVFAFFNKTNNAVSSFEANFVYNMYPLIQFFSLQKVSSSR